MTCPPNLQFTQSPDGGFRTSLADANLVQVPRYDLYLPPQETPRALDSVYDSAIAPGIVRLI